MMSKFTLVWPPTQSETQKSGHPRKKKPSITASGIRIGRPPAETNKSVSNTVYVEIFMVKIFHVANFRCIKFSWGKLPHENFTQRKFSTGNI